MRGVRFIVFLAAALAVQPVTVCAQAAPTMEYWPTPKISFPMDLARVNALNPKPQSIRFLVAPRDGKFELVSSKRPDDLDQMTDAEGRPTGKRGFNYTAEKNCEKEFAVQYEYADGQLEPPTPRLAPDFRVQFLLEAPNITAKPTASNGVRWRVDDDFVLPGSVKLEGRYSGKTPWQTLTTGELRAEDSFSWKNLPPNETLEVRVVAKNLAGHVGRSAVQVIGADAAKQPRGDDKAKAPAPGLSDTPSAKPGTKFGSGFGGADDLNAGSRVPMEHISSRNLIVKSKITHITRSGVKGAQLYVLKDSADWQKAGPEFPLNLTQDSPDPAALIPYTATKDGVYQFIVQPISGADTKAPDPGPNDKAQYMVMVDTTKPAIKLKSQRVTGQGLNGPLLEVEWEASDPNGNLMPEPILLEYKAEGSTQWTPIHGSKNIANSGRHTWEITDKKLWKFLIHATVTDQAGNSAEDITKEPVKVDLDKPSGTVEKVDRESGTPAKQVNSMPNFSGGVQNANSTQPGTMPELISQPVKDVPAPSVGGRQVPAAEIKPAPTIPDTKPAASVSPPPASAAPLFTAPPVSAPPAGGMKVPDLPPEDPTKKKKIGGDFETGNQINAVVPPLPPLGSVELPQAIIAPKPLELPQLPVEKK